MKEFSCALCETLTEQTEDSALLFIGKYGRRYTICPDCEAVMDALVSEGDPKAHKTAVKTVYHYLFESQTPKSPELLDFFKNLLTDGGKTMSEARENVEEYKEEKATDVFSLSDEATDKAVGEATDETEEAFVAESEKPLSLSVRILFFCLFLLLGGGAVTYGILCDSILMIVLGAIVALLGAGTTFSKT